MRRTQRNVEHKRCFTDAMLDLCVKTIIIIIINIINIAYFGIELDESIKK